MKKSILYSLVIFLSVFLGGCEKDEPMGYRGRPGVYFNGKEFSIPSLKILGKMSIRYYCLFCLPEIWKVTIEK